MCRSPGTLRSVVCKLSMEGRRRCLPCSLLPTGLSKSFSSPTRRTASRVLKTRRRRLGQAAAVAGGSIVVTLNVAQLDVTKMSASRTVLFSVSVDTLATGPCLPPMFPLVLTFFCNFSPLVPKAALRTAVAVTFQTTTTVSSALGNPVSALSNVAMMSILGLDECIFSDVDPLDSSGSPLGVGVGNELGQYYRGAVVAALGMYAHS